MEKRLGMMNSTSLSNCNSNDFVQVEPTKCSSNFDVCYNVITYSGHGELEFQCVFDETDHPSGDRNKPPNPQHLTSSIQSSLLLQKVMLVVDLMQLYPLFLHEYIYE